jgi:hypothetical protein
VTPNSQCGRRPMNRALGARFWFCELLVTGLFAAAMAGV